MYFLPNRVRIASCLYPRDQNILTNCIQPMVYRPHHALSPYPVPEGLFPAHNQLI
jgi:hypothetical protein